MANDLGQDAAGVPYEKTIGSMIRESFFYSVLPFSFLSIILLVAYIVLHH